MVDYNIVCNEIAKRVESGELNSEEAQSIMEKADAMYGDGEVLTENYKDSITEKLNDAILQYNTTKTEAKEYIKKKDYIKAEASLKKLLTSLKTIKEEVKSTKPDSKGAATLIVAKSVAQDAVSGAIGGFLFGNITDDSGIDGRARRHYVHRTTAAGAALGAIIGSACKAVKQATADGKVDSTAFDKGKNRVLIVIDEYIDKVNRSIMDISRNVGRQNAKDTVTDESAEDIMQAFDDIDAYLEGCSGCKDKEKSDDECCDKKKKKCKKCDEVTEAVIDAIAERIEAVTEAYLDDKIDEDEYNECMTLLDVNNYDCFFFK